MAERPILNVRANLTVRLTATQVNSVFLVQLRKSVTSMSVLRNHQATAEGEPSGRDSATLFELIESCPENLVEWAAGLSTSSAQEIQKRRGQPFPPGGNF
jgi:hypothetical protein